ncbi:MAG: phenylalanine--tRNA ligase subunit beta [Fusobacterium sp.]|uniref:phenylalanine--tRNA ligase subunit beta n=1 Tax=Fusobacterium sp. TaxID=68766 RepID=UPI0026DC811B|nr:phenylalanine--tRNA ligase subunit beta [Fusobacterium sp.]MDO4690084.1 phenylalanine--tRNA ligase subunit beta [Fusobacterium sp.]
MLISLNWLKQYIDIKENVEELAFALTMIGQEVEAIETQGKHLDNVVIGQIIEFEKHPSADKLSLLKVNIGEEEPLQIICGATNHKLNDKVVVAKIGAILPGEFKIRKNKIRDIESHGMLCSEVELGIGENKDGIIILSEGAPIGQDYREYLNLNDVIFELEITPNRPDCLSHIGIAREIAAYYGRKVKYPNVDLRESIESVNTLIKANIEDKDRCKRYMGRIIKNVEIKESPNWLKERIKSMGLKPINNVVDITNYVMFEYNQPMHAFDFDKLQGNINIRAAKFGEKLITLDGVERELKDSELVIADDVKAIALAGIIGGKSTQIENETKNIFLEVAYFTPENIRKTSRELGIFTDSSYRNERGLDIENLNVVMDRAISLISEVAGGEILSEAIDRYIEKPIRVEIPLNLEKLNKFIGKNLSYDEVGRILTNLDITIKSLAGVNMILVPPSYRTDLQRAADIYEEIIRMYGFENIEARIPEASIESGNENTNFTISNLIRNILKESGLNEVINYSFIPREARTLFNLGENLIEIKNPLSEDMAIMRPSLIYSLVSNIKDNLNRKQNDLKIFEVAKSFSDFSKENLAKEDLKIGIALCGRAERTLWSQSKENYNFFNLKGYVENLFEKLGIVKYSLERSKNGNFHPGVSADLKIGKELLGTFGEIHPVLVEKLGIKREKIYYAEFNLTSMLKYMKIKVNYQSISKYPEVLRDLAVTLDREILVGDMIKEIRKKVSLIEKIDIFDVYSGDKIENNKKSVAMSIVLRDKYKTLEEEEIDKVMTDILNLIKEKYDGEIRR